MKSVITYPPFLSAFQRATLQPLDLLLGRTPVQKATQTVKDAAVELLRAPDGAVVKEGSASGKQIRRTKQRHLAAKEQCSHVCPNMQIPSNVLSTHAPPVLNSMQL